MNIYVVFIAILLLALMVMFGHNPIEEARKKREQEGRDPLIRKIYEYQKENHYNVNGSGMFGAKPGNSGYTYPQQQVPPYSSQNPQQAPQQNNDSYYPPAAPGVPPSPLQQKNQTPPQE